MVLKTSDDVCCFYNLASTETAHHVSTLDVAGILLYHDPWSQEAQDSGDSEDLVILYPEP